MSAVHGSGGRPRDVIEATGPAHLFEGREHGQGIHAPHPAALHDEPEGRHITLTGGSPPERLPDLLCHVRTADGAAAIHPALGPGCRPRDWDAFIHESTSEESSINMACRCQPGSQPSQARDYGYPVTGAVR